MKRRIVNVCYSLHYGQNILYGIIFAVVCNQSYTNFQELKGDIKLNLVKIKESILVELLQYKKRRWNKPNGACQRILKNLDVYIWLKGEPKFGTHVFNKPDGMMPEYISSNRDLCFSIFENKFTNSIDNGSNKGLDGMEQKRRKEESKRKDSASASMSSVYGAGHF